MKKLQTDNIEETALHSRVSDCFRMHVRAARPTQTILNCLENLVHSMHVCVEAIFERQGLALGVYLVDKNDDALTRIDISDVIDAQVDQLKLDSAVRPIAKDIVRSAIARLVYNPTSDEREYLLRLCNTYFLMFALRNEPRIVEYFNGMAQQLTLYVGSDIVIKALSEYYVPSDGQLVSNSLRILKDSGSTLLLSEPALDEVLTHIRASVFEFENYYAPIEKLVTEDIISQIDRILIRSYFYAKLRINTTSNAPDSWRSYIQQFCSYEGVRNLRSRDSLRDYLCHYFGLQFEQRDEMRRSVDREELKRLMYAIIEERKWARKKQAEKLAYNDALHALCVYSKRKQSTEVNVPNPFGYRTWWLTHEKAVQRAALPILGPNKPRFIMRPKFMLNYISLSPQKKEVVESYRAVFPSVLGVNLGKRVPESVLHGVLSAAREAFSVNESRARAMISEFVDRIKADQIRQYDVNF